MTKPNDDSKIFGLSLIYTLVRSKNKKKYSRKSNVFLGQVSFSTEQKKTSVKSNYDVKS